MRRGLVATSAVFAHFLVAEVAQADLACVLGQQGSRIMGMKERCPARFRITDLGEGALRGISRLGNEECAKREVLAVLLEIAELSHGKNLSFDDQWELWCEAQQKKFERMDARYFLRR